MQHAKYRTRRDVIFDQRQCDSLRIAADHTQRGNGSTVSHRPVPNQPIYRPIARDYFLAVHFATSNRGSIRIASAGSVYSIMVMLVPRPSPITFHCICGRLPYSMAVNCEAELGVVISGSGTVIFCDNT